MLGYARNLIRPPHYARLRNYVNPQNYVAASFSDMIRCLSMEIGSILAEARKTAGLLQRPVAEAMGISVSYLSDIEHNRCSFPIERVLDLPPVIRERVASALIAHYHQQADELTKWLPKVS